MKGTPQSSLDKSRRTCYGRPSELATACRPPQVRRISSRSRSTPPRCTAAKRKRRRVRQKKTADSGKILSFDVARKKQIMTAVRDHADGTNEMTIAARNRKIENENDLDVFLEACLRLGVIDSDGNLKS
jgi:hypothetical protein